MTILYQIRATMCQNHVRRSNHSQLTPPAMPARSAFHGTAAGHALRSGCPPGQRPRSATRDSPQVLPQVPPHSAPRPLSRAVPSPNVTALDGWLRWSFHPNDAAMSWLKNTRRPAASSKIAGSTGVVDAETVDPQPLPVCIPARAGGARLRLWSRPRAYCASFGPCPTANRSPVA